MECTSKAEVVQQIGTMNLTGERGWWSWKREKRNPGRNLGGEEEAVGRVEDGGISATEEADTRSFRERQRFKERDNMSRRHRLISIERLERLCTSPRLHVCMYDVVTVELKGWFEW